MIVEWVSEDSHENPAEDKDDRGSSQLGQRRDLYDSPGDAPGIRGVGLGTINDVFDAQHHDGYADIGSQRQSSEAEKCEEELAHAFLSVERHCRWKLVRTNRNTTSVVKIFYNIVVKKSIINSIKEGADNTLFIFNSWTANPGFANILIMHKIKTLIWIIVIAGAVYLGFTQIPKYSDSLGLTHSSNNSASASQTEVPCVTPARRIYTLSPKAKNSQYIVFQYRTGMTFGQINDVLTAVGVKDATYSDSLNNIVGFMVPKSDKEQQTVNKIKSFPLIKSVNISDVCIAK